IGNAVKFTDSGYIKLCAKKVSTKDNYINLILAVEDSGIGISEKNQKLIFELFKQQDGQSNRQYAGTGLGLAISKRLVKMMNGKIAVTSVLGKGSQFEITLRTAVKKENAIEDIKIDTEINLDCVVELSILQDKITQEILPLWEESNIGIEQENIIELAKNLIKLGDIHNVPIFINYGELLQKYIQIFDITNMLELLKKLPQAIEIINSSKN
ncbi:MAG: hypothetical protein IMF12_03290, partial [Proteobacteria bacterium]|nr:hypothetical protein [Pseudomonadota bacterium]